MSSPVTPVAKYSPLALAVAIGIPLLVLIVSAIIVVPPLLSPAPDRPVAAETGAPADSEATSAPAVLTGTWSGAISGDTTPYSTRLVIVDDGTTASATGSYTVPCDTTLVQTARSGATVTLLETVPSGSPCYDQVPVTLTLNADGTLSYSAVSNGLTITSVLVRGN